MKRVASALLAAGMAATLLAGCGGTASSTASSTASGSASGESAAASSAASTESIVTEPVEMDLFYGGGDYATDQAMHTVVDNFNAAYPDITLTLVTASGGSFSEALRTKDSVGEFPDMMDMRDTAQYVRAGKLAPLSDEVKSLFTSVVEFDGVAYTAPYAGANTMGIIYNKNYFEENNLSIPTTYDEFIQLCQTIQDLGDMSPLVVGGSDIWHIGFLYDLAWANDVLEEDPDFIEHCYDGSRNFSDPAFKQTLTDLSQMLTFAQEGWASTPDAQITTFFVNDMSAMMYSGTHMFSQIDDAAPEGFEYGWFAVPDREGQVNLFGGGTAAGWALSAEAAKDPNKQAAFDAFCKFFFSPEQYKLYCEAMNAIPTTKEVPQLDASPAYQAVLDALKTANLHTMWNNAVGNNELPPDFRNFTYKTCIEVAQGTRDVDSACEEIQKTWDVALQSFNPVTGLGIS